MKKYRPKTTVAYYYGSIYKAEIWCYPQSRWELLSEEVGLVRLKNKNVTICLFKDDFESLWVEVKHDTRN